MVPYQFFEINFVLKLYTSKNIISGNIYLTAEALAEDIKKR